MAKRRPAQLRQFFLAMRAVNQIDERRCSKAATAC